MKRYKYYLLILLFSVLLFQFAAIPVMGTHLKPYMIICVYFFFSLGLFKSFSIRKFRPFELAWFLTYLVSTLSIVYSPNIRLALQLVLGQCILVLFYLIFRYLLEVNAETEEIFSTIFSVFICSALVFYIIGCIQVFIFGNTSLFYHALNDHSYRVWGCYFEGDNLPRLMGLSESPNNYVYFATTIMWWFLWKKKTMLASLSLISIILTISTTAIVVVAIQGIIFFLFKKKISLKVFLLLGVLAFVGVYVYNNNEFVQGIIEVRAARNATGSGRFDLWKTTLTYIEKRPILGYGLNQYREVLPQVERASSHNNILESLFSTGIIGCILYLFFLLLFFLYSITLSRNYKTPYFIQLSTAFIVFGMSNNTLTIEYVPFILAFTYSYGFRLSRGKLLHQLPNA